MIWPITDIINEHVTDVIGRIPVQCKILRWILFIGLSPSLDLRRKWPDIGSGAKSWSWKPIWSIRSWHCSSGRPGFEPRTATRGCRGTPRSRSRGHKRLQLRRRDQPRGRSLASRTQRWRWSNLSKNVKSFFEAQKILFDVTCDF